MILSTSFNCFCVAVSDKETHNMPMTYLADQKVLVYSACLSSGDHLLLQLSSLVEHSLLRVVDDNRSLIPLAWHSVAASYL